MHKIMLVLENSHYIIIQMVVIIILLGMKV